MNTSVIRWQIALTIPLNVLPEAEKLIRDE